MYIRKNKKIWFDGWEKKEISRDRFEYIGNRGQVIYILSNYEFRLDVDQNFYLIHYCKNPNYFYHHPIKISYFEYHQPVDVKQLLDNFLEKYVQINC